ncbi:hypothetical protein AAFF_G00386380 [Aldrovandia affinis]|uniref:Uncharacterized protein n=1 Tax=Aldrovandia affinis TaxID=143900 RepID=A0AAD7SFL7_9TELE|nr:hypothetical protein AAFF_G00386380 [Aldrovandia affinis]
MSELVSPFITKELCMNQGCLDYGQLAQMIRPMFEDADELLFRVLSDKSRFVIKAIKEEKDSDCVLSSDSVIVAKTSLRVCQSLPGNCERCDDLHLCRYFVCGYCKYKNECKNVHDLDSEFNTAVLKRLGLQNIKEGELFHLLLQNDSYLLPEICVHYNRGTAEHGLCKFKANCINLHVCMQFVLGRCIGSDCWRAHKFDQRAGKILSGRGVSTGNKRILHKIYRNRFLIANSTETPEPTENSVLPSSSFSSEACSDKICLFFIRGQCTFKEKCIHAHFHLPYEWQVLGTDGSTWKHLPNTEDIEKAYCSPGNDISMGLIPVDFRTMTCGLTKVRRLSTVSSVTKPPDFFLTTNWLWYWKDDKGQWSEYQHKVSGKAAASVTSRSLETSYQEDTDSDILFSTMGHRYILSFKGMYELSVEFQTKREVHRRPRFLSASEVKKKLESEKPKASCSSVACGPKRGDQESLPDVTNKVLTTRSVLHTQSYS